MVQLHPLHLSEHYQGMATATMTQAMDVAELVQLYQAGVWRYLRFLGCEPSLADDLTQETFLTIHRSPFEQRSPQATGCYLRTVARNLFMAALRRSRREPAVEDLDRADEVWRRFAADDGGESYLEALRECVNALDGRARQAIELRYQDDRSRAEIAAKLDLGEEGVKALLRRTREVLRRCIEKRLGLDVGGGRERTNHGPHG
jgi:RNA polymerase sigma-70 factor (ECF subfamily)